MCGGQRSTLSIIPLRHKPPWSFVSFWRKVLHSPQTHQVDWTGMASEPQDPFVFDSSVLEACTSLFCGGWGLNSGPHPHTLLTELSPQLSAGPLH